MMNKNLIINNRVVLLRRERPLIMTPETVGDLDKYKSILCVVEDGFKCRIKMEAYQTSPINI